MLDIRRPRSPGVSPAGAEPGLNYSFSPTSHRSLVFAVQGVQYTALMPLLRLLQCTSSCTTRPSIRPQATLVPTDRLHLDYPPQCARQWAWLQNCAHPILVLSSPLLCTNCLPMLSTSTMWDCCGQRLANNVFRTEYEYKQYSDSHFGPNTNTNILSFRKGLYTNTNDIWLRRFCQIIIKMLPELDC